MEGIMNSVSWLRRTLDKEGHDYTECHHHTVFTAKEMAEAEHVSGKLVAKTVAAKADEKTLLLVLPACRKVSLEKLQENLSAKSVRLLTEKEMATEFPDCEVGAIPPLQHWKEVELWVDSSLEEEKEILFCGGNHTEAIRMAYQDWAQIAKPKKMDFSVKQVGRGRKYVSGKN
jgi:Ala-tRNA(Pro) deacylase